MTDLITELGCNVRVRYRVITDSAKVCMLLDMGPEDGRISPEVLLTREESLALAATLQGAALRLPEGERP